MRRCSCGLRPCMTASLERRLAGRSPDLDGLRRFTGRMAHTSPARLVFTTGFVLCLLLTLIEFLDFSPGRWRYSGS